MIVIDANGDYEFLPGTRTLRTDDHPVFQAQIELNLENGEWIGAPSSGRNFKRFRTVKQTPSKVDEFRKELRFYLQKYDPLVREAAVKRSQAVFPIEIAEDAFSG